MDRFSFSRSSCACLGLPNSNENFDDNNNNSNNGEEEDGGRSESFTGEGGGVFNRAEPRKARKGYDGGKNTKKGIKSRRSR
ncbi:hypothetical protein P167DRAFT_539668 [Morchella conica CCBAS932]|uniref:Uncharacterized protein n=1 Tax=Morchella conica CCBAS932 TaxID=1392247 RepID=A0A3N4KHX6_9PEZI|nr:hypothetical protein P167DRAFT_539668 [Morchella conica CCBAS932]